MNIYSLDLKRYQIKAFYLYFIFKLSKYYITSQFIQQSGECFAFLASREPLFCWLTSGTHIHVAFPVFLKHAKPRKHFIGEAMVNVSDYPVSKFC